MSFSENDNIKMGLVEEIKKNVQILSSSFEKCNLRPLRYNIEPCCIDDDFDFYLNIEIEAIDNSPITSCFIKANIYNDNGDLLAIGSERIHSNAFLGFDTVGLSIHYMSMALKHTKCIRIYCS